MTKRRAWSICGESEHECFKGCCECLGDTARCERKPNCCCTLNHLTVVKVSSDEIFDDDHKAKEHFVTRHKDTVTGKVEHCD